MDKERRKKKREERAELSGQNWTHQAGYQNGSTQQLESSSANASAASGTSYSNRSYKSSSLASDSPNVQSKSKKCDNDMIETEIRTDDFVVRLLLFNFFYKNNKIPYDLHLLKGSIKLNMEIFIVYVSSAYLFKMKKKFQFEYIFYSQRPLWTKS